ncbi:hypothetical protein [Streptomyces sp. Isolate_45]|uniref:hypothetical protein n=1 Tax=Streptomyces sp. Isolate_45 TaxID=2950111 RepID=UPI002481D32E|nr:hypothetical protein [Streptomyces sp. Isolate_45]MDA5284845.1 hypothetical protein [Streptomyces sp. Isolate_45]
MVWLVGAGMFVGLSAMVLGIVTLRTGWVLPMARLHVTRPPLHGLGALLAGAPPLLQGLHHFGFLPGPSWEVRHFGGNALLLAGILLFALAQPLPPRSDPARWVGDPTGA